MKTALIDEQTENFIHTDHLNTPRVIVNANNQLRWTWYPEQAEAFGANRPNENPSNLINGTPTQLGNFSYHLRFPGQLFDPATGLSYNYFRDYNPRTGRFPESDPIGLAGGQVSTYTYVNGNPLWWVDPKGLWRGQGDDTAEQGGGCGGQDYMCAAGLAPKPDDYKYEWCCDSSEIISCALALPSIKSCKSCRLNFLGIMQCYECGEALYESKSCFNACRYVPKGACGKKESPCEK